ncbi:YrdB family protein [Mycetocola reblochoni]|uniref:DUF2568 domain-containing protein n=1 Tax=Mycetocola reblochoni REB411 TaxID=1255698 RepID=A0A1R4KBE8_9MICO|nr:YrdB family protein [Mycetocola reblochoni]SJN41617.1 hypothetical protein FM119_12755 [Mycetocola reblochoni REB411]
MPAAPSPAPRGSIVDVLRVLIELIAVVVLAVWGFSEWAFPLNIVVGLGAPVLAVLLWALFLSPRPVLRTELYLRSLVEIALYVAAAAALWSLGLPVVAVVYLLVASALGLWSGLRRLR